MLVKGGPGHQCPHSWFIQISAHEIYWCFHDLSMTFQSGNTRIYHRKKKIMKCTQICPASQKLYHTHILLWPIWKWNKYGSPKTWKIFASIFIATYWKIIVKKTHDNSIWKIFNFFKLILFNDFHWFTMTFPGKMSFSRPTSNSMIFQGKI